MDAVNSDLGVMPPLRVHFFVNFVHLTGTYFRFHNLAIGLTRLGHQVTVFASDLNYRSLSRLEVRDGVPYQIIPESILIRVLGCSCDPIGWVRRYARRYPPCDVAHLFQPFPSAAAAWLRADTKVRFYDWDDLWIGGLIQGPVAHWREYWLRPLVRLLEHNYLPSRADHVTAISRFLADLARERGGRVVTLLHSGSWPSDELDKATVRSRLGLRPEALYAGFMGRTDKELAWCFEALAENLTRYPQLRLAVCGPPSSCLDGLSVEVRERVDYLGHLSPAAAKDFAACMDLSLLPLAENSFNLSRLPQKFGDYLAARVPLLCSTVGECGRLIGLFPWALPAGTSKAEWLRTFQEAIERVTRGSIPPFDPQLFREHLSWEGISQALAQTYRAALTCRPPTYASNRPLTAATVLLDATD